MAVAALPDPSCPCPQIRHTRARHGYLAVPGTAARMPPPLPPRCGTLGCVAVWRLGALREQERNVIDAIKLIANVGEFERVNDGEALPLKRLTLVYAENGRGKTTLAEILRSLATGNPLGIIERRRIDSDEVPVVVITLAGDSDGAVFADGKWNVPPLTTLMTFDDQFVATNVCSGLEVDNAHRQSLHTLILGERGVALNATLQALEGRRREQSADLRQRAQTILSTVSLDSPELRTWFTDKEDRIDEGQLNQFCAFNDEPDVADKLQEQERLRAAAERQEEIHEARRPETLSLASFNLERIESVLARDLPALGTAAMQRIREHVAHLGKGGERWLNDGVAYLDASDQPTTCPFCLQEITPASLLEEYRRYFSDAYRDLKSEAQQMRDAIADTHGSDAQTRFERAASRNIENLRFWSEICTVENFAIDAQAIVASWENARAAVTSHLEAKRDAPLERLSLSADARDAIARHEESQRTVTAANRSIEQSRRTIAAFVGQLEAVDKGDVNREIMRLTAVQARSLPEVAPLCDTYKAAQKAKEETDHEIVCIRQQLDNHRESTFPEYEKRLNHYLERFSAGYGVKALTPRDTGGPTSAYALEIKGQLVHVNKQDVPAGEYSFGNTLSSGDRSTLAFSMFLTAIDLHPNSGDLTVVIDDPITSLDEHRWRRTITELRKVAQRVEQLIVLSHDRQFLGKIWEQIRVPDDDRVALRIARQDDGSSLREWDVIAETMTDHDRARKLITEYVNSGNGDERDVAEALRVYLEGFLLAVFPDEYRKGTTIGKFIQVCKQRQQENKPVLSSDHIQELEELVKYMNEFHHSGNTSINAGTLTTFAQNTLDFCRMPRYYQLQS